MTDFNPPEAIPPNSHGNLNAQGPKNSDPSSYRPFVHTGSGMDSMKRWLGPKKFKAFESCLCQSITNDMKKNEAAEKKAARKLKASEEGKDPTNVE